MATAHLAGFEFDIPARGSLIVFEGPNGSCMLNEIKSVKKYLRKKRGMKKVIVLSIPKLDSKITDALKEIRNGLWCFYIWKRHFDLFYKKKKVGQTACLLFAASAWDQYHKILKALEDGYTVLCARYIYSFLAYSRVFIDSPIASNFDNYAGLVKPDATFICTESPHLSEMSSKYGFAKQYTNLQDYLKEYVRLDPDAFHICERHSDECDTMQSVVRRRAAGRHPNICDVIDQVVDNPGPLQFLRCKENKRRDTCLYAY